MKTINDLKLEDKVNLLLYKTYNKEYLGTTVNFVIISIILLYIGGIVLFSPFLLETFITEQQIQDSLVVSTGAIFTITSIFGAIIILLSTLLFLLFVIEAVRRRKKLQLAFQMKTRNRFDDVFNISNDDIKDVKQFWSFKNKG